MFSVIRFDTKSARTVFEQTMFIFSSSAIALFGKYNSKLARIKITIFLFFIEIPPFLGKRLKYYFYYKLFGSKKFKFVLRLPVKRATMTEKIVRFGISIEPELLKKYDKIIKKEGYKNRSEAIRDLIRKNLITEKNKNPDEKAIGTLTMIYDHHVGSLTDKLLNIQHDHTKDILVTTHVHIDHSNCLEVLILKGKIGQIQKLADNIKSLKGIKHGELVITKSFF